MKKILFECDICKSLGIIIYDAKIEIEKIIISGNGENNHKIPAANLNIQVCSLQCLLKGIEKFNLGKGEDKDGDINTDA